jgi:hypothetical protein
VLISPLRLVSAAGSLNESSSALVKASFLYSYCSTI